MSDALPSAHLSVMLGALVIRDLELAAWNLCAQIVTDGAGAATHVKAGGDMAILGAMRSMRASIPGRTPG